MCQKENLFRRFGCVSRVFRWERVGSDSTIRGCNEGSFLSLSIGQKSLLTSVEGNKMRCQKLHRNLARQVVALAFATSLLTTIVPRTSYSSRLAKPSELRTASSAVSLSVRSNGKIAFTSDRDSNFEIYVMNSDGSNQTRLTNNPAQDVNPAWSPDGTRIAFVSTRDGNAEIYVMNADGSNQTRITNDLTGQAEPEWSPDGTKLVFAHGSFIQVMNADGSNIKTITGGREPSWSPDGSRIALTAAWDIHVINVESGNLINITNSVELDDQTSWSPDGSKIVFSSTYNPWDYGSQVYVMNADGSNERTILSDDFGYDWDPSWSPDGSRIAYAHHDNRNAEIYVINPDGGNKTKLTNNPSADNTQPDWQSLPVTGIDENSFFVRQHYFDFLNREPDADGLNFWVNEIASCGSDSQCREVKRINVSAAFFLSIEFQETGYLTYRIYKSAFGNVAGTPVPVKFIEFVRDTKQIGTGVRVRIGEWASQLEANKNAFILAFVQRPDFLAAYPNSLTASEFVAKLDTNAGAVLSTTEKNELVGMLGATPADVSKRAAVLRAVAENSQLRAAEFNRAFVLMQYFGYLRRNPNDAPDISFDGYNFWLNKLNSFGGDFVNSEMVKAFITSIEYRGRFDSGPWDY